MKMIKIQKFVMMLVLGAMVVMPMVANGEGFWVDTKSQMGAASSTGNVTGILNKVIGFVLGFIAALAILMIIFAGLMYIISGGNDDKVESAKGYLMYAVVGLIVALLGYAIVSAVNTFIINI